MKIFKYIIFFPYYLWKIFKKGFCQLSLFLSRGFYFYFEKLFCFIKKILPFSFFDKIVCYFQRRREQPTHIVFIIVCFVVGMFLFDSLYVDSTDYVQAVINPNITPKDSETVEKVPEKTNDENLLFSTEMNYYRIYGKYTYQDISIPKLKETNPDTVFWISVSNTNINYPVVQTDNNDFYLSHSFDKSFTMNGWVFMDYRNTQLEDTNTIFYGHNLLNKTAFGSLEKLFKLKDQEIIIKVIGVDHVYTYKVFSGYLIGEEVYYLQNKFYSNREYQEFLNVISGRNVLSVPNEVTVDDKIITLSTCTNDNKGRRVVHAKLISVE